MISVTVPGIGDILPEFTVEASAPNYWNERLCFVQCILYENLHAAGYAFQQLEESDGQDLVDEATLGITQMIADIESAYI